jgi:hypothetical protein
VDTPFGGVRLQEKCASPFGDQLHVLVIDLTSGPEKTTSTAPAAAIATSLECETKGPLAFLRRNETVPFLPFFSVWFSSRGLQNSPKRLHCAAPGEASGTAPLPATHGLTSPVAV